MAPSFKNTSVKLSSDTGAIFNVQYPAVPPAGSYSAVAEPFTLHTMPSDTLYFVDSYAAQKWGGGGCPDYYAVRDLKFRVNTVREGLVLRQEIFLDMLKHYDYFDTTLYKGSSTRVFVFSEDKFSDGTTIEDSLIYTPAGSMIYELVPEYIPIAKVTINIPEGNSFITRTLTAVATNFGSLI